MFKVEVITTGRRRRRWLCPNCKYRHEATEQLYIYTCRSCGATMPIANKLLERYLGVKHRLSYHNTIGRKP